MSSMRRLISKLDYSVVFIASSNSYWNSIEASCVGSPWLKAESISR